METLAWFMVWGMAPVWSDYVGKSFQQSKKKTATAQSKNNNTGKVQRRLIHGELVALEADITDEQICCMEDCCSLTASGGGGRLCRCCDHGWFESSYQSAKLHYRKWLPAPPPTTTTTTTPTTSTAPPSPRAIVIFMHGISTHSGKAFVRPPPDDDGAGKVDDANQSRRCWGVALLAEVLMQHNVAVYAFDLYGHGLSEGERYWIPNSWTTNRDDYITFCRLVAAAHPHVPILYVLVVIMSLGVCGKLLVHCYYVRGARSSLTEFHTHCLETYINDLARPTKCYDSLAGESYGGTLTLHVARYFQQQPNDNNKLVDSIMLLAPAIIGDISPSPIYELLVFLAGYFPKWRPFFMPNPVSPHRIWRDESVRTAMIDPHGYHSHIDGSGRPFRLGTGLNLVQALAACRAMLSELTTPFLILHGTKDYAVPIAGSELLWRMAPTSSLALQPLDSSEPRPSSRFCRLDGAYHDLLADPVVADQCLDEIVQWIEGRLS
jgi:alpha-beta hydrolase superfamily lysophospholipase